MSNADKLRALGIPVPHHKTAGQTKVRCPRCASDAKHKNKTDLSVDLDNGQWRCHNTPECNYKGFVDRIVIPEKVYVKPVPRTNVTPLRQDIVDFFASRKISQQTLLKTKVLDGPNWMRANKNWPHDGVVHTMQFQYFENGELVNVKYRSAMKQFTFITSAKLIFYNIDGIKGHDWCMITEGEPDTLTCVEAGYDNTCSVPNGASASDNSRLEFLDNNWEHFEDKKKIILMTDDDLPGRSLQAELVRRFGAERCYTVTYGEGCKDINEHACKYGILSVKEVIDNAKPCPIKGVKTANDLRQQVLDLFHEGLKPGARIGIRDSDTNEELLSFLEGQLTTITGIPNAAKTEMCEQIAVKLAIDHNWRFAIYSPENFPPALLVAKFIEKLTGKHFAAISSNIGRITVDDIVRCLDWILDRFFVIFDEDNETDLDLDDILALAKKMIKRYGINGLIIDPWNTLEHQRPAGMNETDYMGKCLNKIVKFNRRNSVHTFIVAHPTKMKKDKGGKKYVIPTLYDISGTAHFFNKTDNGITMYRDYTDNTNTMYVQKVKYKHQGKVGSVKYRYNILNGRLSEINSSVMNNDWLLNPQAEFIQPAIDFQQVEGTEIITQNNNTEEDPF